MGHNFGPDEIARLRAFLQQSEAAIGMLSQTGTSAASSASSSAQPHAASSASSSAQLHAVPPSSQPQIAPSASGIQPQQSAPITQVYQPSGRRSQNVGHPQPTGGQSASFHPFLGLNLPTANANQARMASASSTIPRSTPLPHRGRRGPAQHPPSLPPVTRRPSAELCHGFDISGASILRILVKVMPPPPVSIIYFTSNHQDILTHRIFPDWQQPSSATISFSSGLSYRFSA